MLKTVLHSTSPVSFHCFCELTPELRLDIWDLAVAAAPPRTITLHEGDRRAYKSTTIPAFYDLRVTSATLALLNVNQESRRAAKKVYKAMLHWMPFNKLTYFNFEKDRLYIEDSYLYPLFWKKEFRIIDYARGEEDFEEFAKNVPHLALNHSVWLNEIYKARRLLHRTYMTNLAALTLVSGPSKDQGANSRGRRFFTRGSTSDALIVKYVVLVGYSRNLGVDAAMPDVVFVDKMCDEGCTYKQGDYWWIC